VPKKLLTRISITVCAKIELEFVPYANFATTNGLANGRLPQMYFTVDRVANVYIPATEAEMQERGISPKLWRSKMKFAWRPNLLQHVQLETNQPTDGGGLPLGIDALNAILIAFLCFNKWLPTQQSYGFSLKHLRNRLRTKWCKQHQILML